jgi:hypothetical protein
MTFHEPTSGQLKAACGWTLLKRSETTPEHVVALDKYRDGCEALIPFSPDGVADAALGEKVKLPAQSSPPPRLVQPIVAEGCTHHFSMYSQKCSYCGSTRRQALASRGRKPELIEQ